MFGLADVIEDAANELKREVALFLIERLLNDTPVDTSQALSNWRASTQGTIGGWIDPYVRGEAGSTKEASLRAALARARAEIMRSKPGMAISIFNNVPYIRRLNEGYSAQAPAGFVEAATMLARRFAKERGLKLKL